MNVKGVCVLTRTPVSKTATVHRHRTTQEDKLWLQGPGAQQELNLRNGGFLYVCDKLEIIGVAKFDASIGDN